MMFTRACTTSTSCSFGLHQTDCCGTRKAIGFNHDQTMAFGIAEAAWEATCPACGCAEGPTTADDGSTCMPNVMPTVTCDNNVCTTHCGG